ncbi:Tat (twin-arginine translocation) pathway signal sequence containing protein [Maribacter sp. 1_2014MBL_MicDiv]|uniref:Tat (twin-arginine translocation) pathway signal sequence containing protein n=1 Tax=Maribacter sp. 1_2014MBL_MicDiv TaxID=1644130 RepID=UPI0008F4EC2F|nr:Tat (twin-arginine translocation) pathway signal sequence containing protein [Maribacter sp. 1_2014MBL_MicDiv]APA64818.1 Tat (twin-arginine translocation) pathway signal sequence containing protein [Maribacter sp. 1_2014MBL_MicDiv]
MKRQNKSSRRKFMGAVLMGATASTFSLITGPVYAAMPNYDDKKMAEVDNWFNKIKGTHRIVYDGSTPHDGFPIIWNWAFYLSNNETGSKDDDITAMTVLRHNAIPFALKSEVWKKYKLGEVFGVNDNATNAAALRNPYYEPQNGDFPMPEIQGIKEMQERGAMFCVCNLALSVYSGAVAENMDLDAKKVYQEWVDAVHPEIQIVPSGVWALGRAQQNGCGYIFAGN